MINLRYFCFVVIQLYLKVRALALFYFINLHHYTYITAPKMSIHRDATYLAHPDVFIYRKLNLIHRDGVWILNPDVSPLKSVSQIHRNGPETAKSDVSPQKQVSKYIGEAS